MTKVTVEEKKALAEWMEYNFIDYLHVKDKNGHYIADGAAWPEGLSRYLTEVLERLSLTQESKVWRKLRPFVTENVFLSPLSIEKWFQNPENAPTILRAVIEVLKEDGTITIEVE